MNDRPSEIRPWAVRHVFFAALTGLALATGIGLSAEGPAPKPVAEGTAAPEQRLREGTEWSDQVGMFRTAGDRVAFFSDKGGPRLVVLENLMLERVVRAIEISHVELQWSVSGVVTECHGVNYLLVRRAVVLGPASVRTP